MPGKPGPLDASHFEAAKEQTVALNGDGFRVVAVAYKDIEASKPDYTIKDEAGLTLLGYIAFLDPPKDSARGAIAALARKGVHVKILTGDNEVISRKICPKSIWTRASCSAAKSPGSAMMELAESPTARRSSQSLPRAEGACRRALHVRGTWSVFSATASTIAPP